MRLSYQNRTVLILALVGAVAAIDVVALNFLAPFVATTLHLSNAEIGTVSAISQSAWAIGAIITALWSDRIGRRRVFLVGALLGFAVLSSATALATSFLTLLVARTLIGLVEGPVVPMQNAIMHAESTPARRGINMGIAQNFGSQLAAGMVGPLGLVGIATRFGWRDAFLVAAVPALVMAGVVRWGLREPARGTDAAARPPLWRTVKALASVRNIQLCFLVGACGIGWWATLSTFIPLWLVRVQHFSPAVMGETMAWVGPSGAGSAILVPALSDRFGRRPMVVSFALVGLVVPLALLFGPASPLAVGGVLFLGWTFMGIFPLFIGIVPMESVDARFGATALAIVLAGAQITGSLAGPLLGGVLADRYSLAATLWLTVGFALGAAAAGVGLRETAPRKAGAVRGSVAGPSWG